MDMLAMGLLHAPASTHPGASSHMLASPCCQAGTQTSGVGTTLAGACRTSARLLWAAAVTHMSASTGQGGWWLMSHCKVGRSPRRDADVARPSENAILSPLFSCCISLSHCMVLKSPMQTAAGQMLLGDLSKFGQAVLQKQLHHRLGQHLRDHHLQAQFAAQCTRTWLLQACSKTWGGCLYLSSG